MCAVVCGCADVADVCGCVREPLPGCCGCAGVCGCVDVCGCARLCAYVRVCAGVCLFGCSELALHYMKTCVSIAVRPK